MFPSAGLHRSKDGAHDDATDADEGDHHDEPSNGDGLGDGDAAARLRCLFLVRIKLPARPGKNSTVTKLSLNVPMLRHFRDSGNCLAFDGNLSETFFAATLNEAFILVSGRVPFRK